MAQFKNIYGTRALTFNDNLYNHEKFLSIVMPDDGESTMVLSPEVALALANHIYGLYGIEVPKPTPGDFKHGDKIVDARGIHTDDVYEAVEVGDKFYYRLADQQHPTLWPMRHKNNWRKA